MLRRISVTDFKGFRRATVDLGGMNVLVGANGSGKSNLFDALRVLQGAGNGLTVREILDSGSERATDEAQEGLRGGSAGACFLTSGGSTTFEIEAAGRRRSGEPWIYSISISPGAGRVAAEVLGVGDRTLYEIAPQGDLSPPVPEGRRGSAVRGVRPRPGKDRSRPVLRRFAEKDGPSTPGADAASEVAALLRDMQRFDPAPSVLRRSSPARPVERMGQHGEGFAAVVAEIDASHEAKSRYRDWLREFHPGQGLDIGVRSGSSGERIFVLRKGGQEFPAPVLGDGTLRFAAILAAFSQPSLPGLLMIEGLEQGVHPSQARLLTELVRRHSGAGGPQVLVTTHSPAVLAWLQEAEYDRTFLCRREAETGRSTIRPVRTLAGFDRAVRGRSVAELLAEGWMEAAS